MKNRSSRYNINRPRRWHGHKYTKYKICFHIMMVISIRRFLNVLCTLNLCPVSTGEADLKKALLI